MKNRKTPCSANGRPSIENLNETTQVQAVQYVQKVSDGDELFNKPGDETARPETR